MLHNICFLHSPKKKKNKQVNYTVTYEKQVLLDFRECELRLIRMNK